MASPGDLYRVAEPGWLSGDKFSAALFASVRADGPENGLAFRSRWYCWDESCPVREMDVTIRCYPEDRLNGLPEMQCPLCKKGMEFRGYLKTVTLVPGE